MSVSPPTPDVVAALTTAAIHLEAAKYYTLASFTMMVYDIILTLPVEIEKIWTKKFTGVTILWFLNRWWFLLAVVPALAAFFDARMTGHVYASLVCPTVAQTDSSSRCDNFYRYTGIVAACQRMIIGTIFALRMYAIYGRSLKVAALIYVFLIAEVIAKIVTTVIWGKPVQLPPGFIACVLSVDQKNSKRFIIYWVLELATDTCVVVLTMFRSWQLRSVRKLWQSQLMQVLMKDGLVYFLIMFAVNLTTCIFYIVMPEDLKAINAYFGVMINCIMTSRLILNLRVANSRSHAVSMEEMTHPGYTGAPTGWEANIIGNLGNEFEGSSEGSRTDRRRSDAEGIVVHRTRQTMSMPMPVHEYAVEMELDERPSYKHDW